MKTDTDEIILEEVEQNSHLEELLNDLQNPQTQAALQKFVGNDGNDEKNNTGDVNTVIKDSRVLWELITEQANVVRFWQIAAGATAVFAVAVCFAALTFYMSRASLSGRVNNAETAVQTVNNQITQAQTQVKNLENQLAQANAQLVSAQEQTAESDLKIKNLQKQLTDTTAKLKALQNANAEAVKQLNERLQKLSASRKD